MLLSITNRCKMGCPHCFSNCEPEGTDMSMETLDEIIEFINNPELRFSVVLVSGGEPSEHPRLFDILDRLYETNTPNKWGEKKLIMLATNGMFLNMNTNAEDYRVVKEYSDHLLSYRDLYIQITADPRFYNTKLNERNLKYLQKKGRSLVRVEHSLTILCDYGRALTGDMPTIKRRLGPFCFNARSMATGGYNFARLVEEFETKMNKQCAIGFDMHGNIRISESLTCSPIGTVQTTLKDLSSSIQTMRCQECLPFKHLSLVHKRAIGMA